MGFSETFIPNGVLPSGLLRYWCCREDLLVKSEHTTSGKKLRNHHTSRMFIQLFYKINLILDQAEEKKVINSEESIMESKKTRTLHGWYFAASPLASITGWNLWGMVLTVNKPYSSLIWLQRSLIVVVRAASGSHLHTFHWNGTKLKHQHHDLAQCRFVIHHRVIHRPWLLFFSTF